MGFGKDGQGQIIYDQTRGGLGALAALDAVEIGGSYNDALVEDFRIMKMDYWMAILPATAITILDGPIIIGLAAGQITAAQVEQALEAVPLNSDATALEESNRPVWPLEIFLIPDADLADNATLVRKGSINLRWTFNNPSGWVWWAYNVSSGALTTGSIAVILAKMFGMWVP